MAQVTAVVVTYQPGAALAQLVKAIAPQVHDVLVIDNGSSAERREAIAALAGGRVEPVFLGANLGVGRAHNVGIGRARERGASHVLLLDQDSQPEASMVERLLAAEGRLLAGGEPVGAVGPVYFDERVGKAWPFYAMTRFGVAGRPCREGGEALRCDFLITSGMLVRLSVLEAVGAMNEEYFIEHIDTEWSLRARRDGYRLFGVCGARMNHTLGDAVLRVPLSGRRVQIYRPERHYYLFRNAVRLARSGYAPFPWLLNEIRRLLLRLVFFPLFVAPRARRLELMLLGLWHGVLGRGGPLPEKSRESA